MNFTPNPQIHIQKLQFLHTRTLCSPLLIACYVLYVAPYVFPPRPPYLVLEEHCLASLNRSLSLYMLNLTSAAVADIGSCEMKNRAFKRKCKSNVCQIF